MPQPRTIDFYDHPREVFAVGGTELIAYSWSRCLSQGNSIGKEAEPDAAHEHTIDCLWVWHDCAKVYPDEERYAERFRGQRAGWTPTGVGAHTLVSIEPLTITASVYWPECCGQHGFITDGSWIQC